MILFPNKFRGAWAGKTSEYAFGVRGHSSIPNIHQVDFLCVNLHSTPAAGWGCF